MGQCLSLHLTGFQMLFSTITKLEAIDRACRSKASMYIRFYIIIKLVYSKHCGSELSACTVDGVSPSDPVLYLRSILSRGLPHNIGIVQNILIANGAWHCAGL